jgi:16S rRNA (uracil1498-N3)-methyltransferase
VSLKRNISTNKERKMSAMNSSQSSKSIRYLALPNSFYETPAYALLLEQSQETNAETPPVTFSLDDADTAHYASTVLRLKPKQHVVLVDFKAGLRLACTLLEVKRSKLQLALIKLLKTHVELPACNVVLAAVVIKEQRWDWLLQKATELGVTSIQSLESDHSVVKDKTSNTRHERWQTIVKHAALQSERLSLPHLQPVLSLKDWLAQQSAPVFVALERKPETVSFATALNERLQKQVTAFSFLIGPEGGWSTEEKALFTNTAACVPVSLGSGILRSETAAIAMLSYCLLHSNT